MGLMRSVSYQRWCRERVVWSRGCHSPFQAFSSFPDFSSRFFAAHDGFHHDEQEQQLAETKNKRAEARHHIEVGKLQRIVGNTPRHTGETQEVLREKQDVDTHER